MSERFDVVIFGASGYTGKYAIFSAINILKSYKWAVAGRNKEKLLKVLKKVEQKANADLSKIPIIIADINDEKSLQEMTAKAKVLVNCCGPYRFYGEAVVKACIETSTSHVDVSGEPQYMETMQLKYNDSACQKGVYIVSACGFDSIPADMGIVFLQQKFNGTVNSVETYLRAHYINDYNPTGAGVHYATFESAVHGFVYADELKEIRKKLFSKRLPRFNPKLEEKSTLHKSKDVDDRWCLMIPSADHSVVMRSQRFFYEHDNRRPIQMKSYNAFDTLLGALKTIGAGLMFSRLTKYKCGKDMLLRYPEIFSFNFASKEGPTEERNSNTNFETLFIGQGWNEKLSNPNQDISYPMNKKMIARVVVNNPLYGGASKAVLLAAVTILEDRENMPEAGVLSPGAAFKNTKYIERLQEHGFIFEVLKSEELKAKL